MHKASIFVGHSTEEKPNYSLAVEGSFYYELDSKDLYILNGHNWEIFGGGSGGGGSDLTTFLNNITLTQANWVYTSGDYEYTYSNAAFTETSVINVVPLNAYMTIIQDAVMYPLVTVTTGAITLYCKNEPAGDIVINITVGV